MPPQKSDEVIMPKASQREYDVIIVGGGPAGIFAAMELAQEPHIRVLMLEKGRDLDHRECPIIGKSLACPPCLPCDMVTGFGGAGAFSDGKLTLSPNVGGRLQDYLGYETTQELIRYVDEAFLRFGGIARVFGIGDEVDQWARRASLAELRLTPSPLRHLGTERLRQVLSAMHGYLAGNVEILTRTEAASILAAGGTARGVLTDAGQELSCRYLVVAPGREGAEWLVEEARRLRLTLHLNPVDLGVRVEVPAAVLEDMTSVLYEGKLEFYSPSFDDRIRTFCMCPHGEVIMESTGGVEAVTTVNGHSYTERRTDSTNFALLVSTTFTEPFKDPIAYGRYLARLANILSDGVLVQRLGDLREGRRSTPARIARSIVEPTLKAATPGDLSCVLPYRFLKGIMEMLEALDRLAPGVASRHTLLYGLEVKFYSSRLQLSSCLESEIGNLFAAGDGAGVSRGLVQAAASGVIVGREILERVKRTSPPQPRAAKA